MAKRVFPVNLPWAPTPKFTLIKKLGKGSYGTVYKAEEDGQEFAVKILSMTKKYGIESPTELDIMTRLSHPNLIHCCGIYPIQNINPRSKTNQLALKMPLAHSDLCGYLKKNTITWVEKFGLIHACALGLAFMHSNLLLHLDVKPENVLIFRNGSKLQARLTDFGLSLYTNRKRNRDYERELVTLHYRCPEALLNPTHYSGATDIWSLGILMIMILRDGHEVFTRYDRQYNDILRMFYHNRREKTLSMFLSKVPKEYKDPTLKLLYKILSLTPENRPSIAQVL